jgi:probable HAF family extracellular repeat protein
MPMNVFTTIDDLPGIGTEAIGINDAGQIVGLFLDASDIRHGFLFSGGVFTPAIDDPSAADMSMRAPLPRPSTVLARSSACSETQQP